MSNLVISELRPMQEEDIFTKEEEDVLREMKNKKLALLLTTYISLVAVLIYGGIEGVLRSYRWGPDEVARAKKLAPYLIIFCFLLLTVYFFNYFRKSIQPLMKDLKAGYKKNQFFIPGKYMPPFVPEYYVKTPLAKTPLIRIDKELYDCIHTGSTACISYAPYSKFVLSIEVDRKKINFNYSISMDDI
jgi:hypothetical protein